jgi:hypothetical protein
VTLSLGGQRGGHVRAARLTDLAALANLSRLSHADGSAPVGGGLRSLGLPVSGGHVSAFSLFRMPLGALAPRDLLYVHEEHGRVTGLARVELDEPRHEWTIVELDALDDAEAGDVRFRLVQHLLRAGGRRGAERFHVACADASGNVELFMQAGFVRYGEEVIMVRAPEKPLPSLPAAASAADARIRPTVPLDALKLDKLYRSATPAAVGRLEGYRIHDWERQGSHWHVPRSALTPILRFADVESFLLEGGGAPDTDALAFIQIGVAKEDQPHYVRVISAPGHDPRALIDYGLAVIGERVRSGLAERLRSGLGERSPTERGIVTAVRTYEAPLDRRLEEAGFTTLARVALLLRESTARVAAPALVPAASR